MQGSKDSQSFPSLRSSLAVLQQAFDVVLHSNRIVHRSEPLHGLPIAVDKELCKVPLDGINKRAALLLLQPLPDGMSIPAIHVNLVVQVELSPVFAPGECLDLLVGAWLLATKLVAGKGRYLEPLILVAIEKVN